MNYVHMVVSNVVDTLPELHCEEPMEWNKRKIFKVQRFKLVGVLLLSSQFGLPCHHQLASICSVATTTPLQSSYSNYFTPSTANLWGGNNSAYSSMDHAMDHAIYRYYEFVTRSSTVYSGASAHSTWLVFWEWAAFVIEITTWVRNFTWWGTGS